MRRSRSPPPHSTRARICRCSRGHGHFCCPHRRRPAAGGTALPDLRRPSRPDATGRLPSRPQCNRARHCALARRRARSLVRYPPRERCHIARDCHLDRRRLLHRPPARRPWNDNVLRAASTARSSPRPPHSRDPARGLAGGYVHERPGRLVPCALPPCSFVDRVTERKKTLRPLVMVRTRTGVRDVADCVRQWCSGLCVCARAGVHFHLSPLPLPSVRQQCPAGRLFCSSSSLRGRRRR